MSEVLPEGVVRCPDPRLIALEEWVAAMEHNAPRQDKERWSPDDLVQLARRDATVNNFLTAWRLGHLTWEQSLIGAVCELARQNENLLRKAMISAFAGRKSFIVSGDLGQQGDWEEAGDNAK